MAKGADPGGTRRPVILIRASPLGAGTEQTRGTTVTFAEHACQIERLATVKLGSETAQACADRGWCWGAATDQAKPRCGRRQAYKAALHLRKLRSCTGVSR